MALDRLVLPGRLAVGPVSDTAPRVNKAQFGDGYSQRSGDGLNADPQTFSGTVVNLSPAKAADLVNFLRAHKVVPFVWSLPMKNVDRKWTATKWSESFTASNRSAVSFTLTEVFDL
jgi:phage-related protein